jgi:type I restriction enzyme M protein
MGHLVDRTHRDFSDEDLERITQTYHAWRGETEAGEYKDTLGFCKSGTVEEIASHSYVLTPGRYVGSEALEDDSEPFEEKLVRLTATLEEQFAESARLEQEIRDNLQGLSYEL